MNNVKIKSLGIYHPENKVTNEYYLDHFKKQGKDISRLLEAFGREERYIVNNSDDNAIMMAIKASENALNKAGLKGSDIDVILYSSLIPEYTMPPQSLIIHNAINGKKEALVMDTNVNCVGMVVAVDTATRYLQNHKEFKRALIVGSDNMSAHLKDSDEMTYPQFGDLACAVILEKTEEDRGFIGSTYITDSSNWDIVRYPASGNSKSYHSAIDDIKVHWTPFDGGFIIEHAKNGVDKLLLENNLKISDISSFFVSQYAVSIGQGCAEAFDVDPSKVPYVGNKYGYTGTTSPFLAMYDSIENGKVKDGDYIVFWSVGTNWTTCAMIFKY